MLEDGHMNWKPGDIAILKRTIRCVITPALTVYGGATVTLGPAAYEEDWWHVTAEDGTNFQAREIVLRKPYDGNEKTEWKTCVFQPKELVVTT